MHRALNFKDFYNEFSRRDRETTKPGKKDQETSDYTHIRIQQITLNILVLTGIEKASFID